MSRSILFLVGPLALAIAVGISGCKSEEKTNEQITPAKTQPKTGDQDTHAGHVPEAPADLSPAPPDFDTELAKLTANEQTEVNEAFAELSPEDQAGAKKQVFCPVTGELLGHGMGAPYKIDYEGRTVFFCCKMCQGKFEADPQKYLAALPK